MRSLLVALQIIVSLLLTVCILLQAKGTGFGSTWSAGQYYTAKRGVEKFVFVSTIVLAGAFVILSLLQLI